METRVPSTLANRILKRFHFTNLAAVETRGFSGGLWCLWNNESLNIQVMSYTAQMMNLAIMENNRVVWMLSLVYASPTLAIRDTFYTYVENMAKYINVPWCLIGDFNQVIKQEDKRGGRAVRGYGIEHMHHMLHTGQLLELPFLGPRFTWSNRFIGRRLIQQRLDQVWCNGDWFNKFPEATLSHLARTHSDQHPLLLVLEGRPQAKPLPHFRFQAAWMEHKLFEPFIKEAWINANGDFCQTVNEFTQKMTTWRKEVYSNLPGKIRRCEVRIRGIQNALSVRPSRFLSELERELLAEYHELIRQEEVYWAQKAKLNWLANGERNTRFFHMTVNRRRRRNKVARLKDSRGEWTEDPQTIRQLIREYYNNLFAENDTMDAAQYTYDYPILSNSEKDMLNRKVALCEIEAVVFQMGAYKAPGPDGLPPLFFQRNWNVVGESVCRFVLQAFQNRGFPQHLNEALITLIPKVPDPEHVSQFRPLALMNVVVKVITKIIANRLKGVIDKLVAPTHVHLSREDKLRKILSLPKK